MRVLMRNIGAGKSALQRARLIAKLFVKMPRLNGTAESHCEVAQSLADDLGCSVRVREALGYSFERWDGKGIPRKKKGEAIPLAMRVVQVADDAQAFHRAGGVDAAVAMLAARAGKGAGPDAGGDDRARARPSCWRRWTCASVWDAAIAAEPGAPDYVDDDGDRRRAAGDGRVRGSEVVVHARAFDGRGGAGGGRGRAAGPGAGGGRGGAARRLRARRRARGRVGGRVGEGGAADRRRMGEGADARGLHGADPGAAAAARAAGRAGLAGPRTDGRHRLSAPAARRRRCRRARAARGGGHVPGDARDAPAPARRSRARRWRRRWRSEAEKGRLDREAVRAVLETAGHRAERGRARGRQRRTPAACPIARSRCCAWCRAA